jgi:serine/threonine-protein kinase
MPTCSSCGTSYDSTVRICVLDGTPLSTGPVDDPYVGTLLDGKYKIDKFISGGGMGAVYRATHVLLNKRVAVKVIRKELVTSDEVVRRFQREARAASNLDHPNIVSVYDLGQTPDGTLYIAMEYIDGPSLKEAIKREGPMAPGRVVDILQQVSNALSAAHRKQIVHRDLKSQNLMLATSEDGRTVVKLVDFGIAKTFDEPATQLTAAGYVIGTPHYMSPEQAAGRAVDHRTDLYAVGVIMYEMLVGEVPFDDGSLTSVLLKQMTEPPEPPSRRRPDVQVPPALETIALRCLEKEPANRFQSADEFGQALHAAGVDLASAPTSAGTHTSGPTLAAGPAAPTLLSPRSAVAPTIVKPPNVLPPDLPVEQGALVPTNNPRTMAVQSTAPATGRSRWPAAAFMIVVLLAAGALAWGLMRPQGTPSTGEPTAVAADAPPRDGAATPDPESARQPSSPTEPIPARPTDPIPSPAAVPPPFAPLPSNPTPSGGSGGGVRATTPGVTLGPGPGGAPVPGSAPSSPRSGRPSEPAPSPTPGAAPPAPGVVPPPPATTQAAAPVANPPVFVRCTGPAEVCTAIRAELTRSLQRESLPVVTTRERADVELTATVELVSETSSNDFGTPLTTRTYSVDLSGESHGTAVPSPPGRTFSFDPRVGNARLQENARLIASDAVDAVRAFWSKR